MTLRRILAIGVGVAAVAIASQANANSVAFTSFGYALPPGETLYTDFSSGLPSGATGNGSIYTPTGPSQSGLVSGSYVASPSISTTAYASGPFFAVNLGQSETFTFTSPVWDVSIYIGSLDDGNTLILHTASGDVTYTGTQLAGYSGQTTPIPAGGGYPFTVGTTVGTIGNPLTNGRWTFADWKGDITGFTITETGVVTNSFEIASIATSVPEPSTWAMMGLGFAGLAFVGYRTRRTPVAAAL